MKQLLVVAVCLSCLCFTGIVFGFANLRLVLERDGQFEELCDAKTDATNTAVDAGGVCKTQDDRFNLMYTIATCAVAMMALPSGIFIDRFGPTKSALLSCLCLVASLVGVGHFRSAVALIPCFAVVGAAGVLTFMGSFPVSFLVRSAMQPLVLTVVNCSFDASSAVFLIFDQIHRSGNISRTQLFDGYAMLAAVVLGTVTVLWFEVEGKPSKEIENSDGSSGTSTSSSANSGVLDEVPVVLLVTTNDEKTHAEANDSVDADYPTYHTDPLRVQMRTFEYFLSVIFVCVHLLRSNTYLGMNKSLLEDLGDRDHDFLYTTIFGATLPLSCVVAPCIGAGISKYGCGKMMMLVNVLGVLHGICSLVPNLQFQIVTFLVYTNYRALLYSVSATFNAQVFGPKTVGTIHGSVFLIGSVFNALQFPALWASNKYADRDLRYVSSGLLAANFVSAWFTHKYKKRVEAFQAQKQAQESQQTQVVPLRLTEESLAGAK